jgi:hypothetical protein
MQFESESMTPRMWNSLLTHLIHLSSTKKALDKELSAFYSDTTKNNIENM